METAPPPGDAVHATAVVVWNVPPAVVAGDSFRVTIGAKCIDGCPLAGRTLRLVDHQGVPVVTATLSAEIVPGTGGLHVADVELRAPADEGLHTWTVTTTPDTAAADPAATPAHAESSAGFSVRVVGQPDCEVTVEAVDADGGRPLGGARIIMHPYRTETDDTGIARVRAAKGSYTLFVSRSRYVTLGLPLELASDQTVRAVLRAESLPERN